MQAIEIPFLVVQHVLIALQTQLLPPLFKLDCTVSPFLKLADLSFVFTCKEISIN
jgi:hypothetical protein